jgi:crotonobetainyl-CoA:carnitine CoA-transferase CaiB-like acyl-CoA transferase
VVIAPYELADNPQLRHRHLFEPEHHPVTGTHDVPGLPFRFGNVPAWIRRPAPTLGQHDDEVLRPDPVRSP